LLHSYTIKQLHSALIDVCTDTELRDIIAA
jgi:hypothetical protein